MVFTEYMKVKNNLIVDTKYGKRRVINLIAKNGEEGAVWASDLDSLTRIKPNQTVEVIRGAKGNLTILEKEQPKNINGAGGHPNSNCNTQQVATSASISASPDGGRSDVRGAVENYLDNDLGLPELLTDRQKKDLKKLTVERAKLLVFCIETMKQEMDAKGFEFHENSVRYPTT